MLSRFRAIIFDFDGVLVDSERLQARAWTQVADELRLPLREITMRDIAGKLDRHIAPEYFSGHADPTACIARKQAIERGMEEAGELGCIQPTLDFARAVSRTHALAVCSSSRPPRIERLLTHFGVRDLFPIIVGQVDGEECKPSPAPYLKALRLLNVPAPDACAIEDSHTGLTAAKAAHLFAVQLLHEGMDPSPLADIVIPSCATLLAAHS